MPKTNMKVVGGLEDRSRESMEIRYSRKAMIEYLMKRINYRKQDCLRKYRALYGHDMNVRLVFMSSEPLRDQLKELGEVSYQHSDPSHVRLMNYTFALESAMFILEKWGFEALVDDDGQFVEILESKLNR